MFSKKTLTSQIDLGTENFTFAKEPPDPYIFKRKGTYFFLILELKHHICDFFLFFLTQR